MRLDLLARRTRKLKRLKLMLLQVATCSLAACSGRRYDDEAPQPAPPTAESGEAQFTDAVVDGLGSARTAWSKVKRTLQASSA